MWLACPAVVVSLLAVGHAILLPPDTSSFETEATVQGAPYSDLSIIELACGNCPVAEREGPDGGIKWVEGVESKLRLAFFISPGYDADDVDTLWLNGFPIYPSKKFFPMRLAASQISPKATTKPYYSDFGLDTKSMDLELGYELSITPVPTSNDDHQEIFDIRIQIVEIVDKFVDGLESIQLRLLKATPSGSLKIDKLEVAPTTNPGGKNCKTLVCKLKAIVANKLPHNKPTGCGSRRRPVKSLPASSKHDGNDRHGHQSHKPHHGPGRWIHRLRRFARHILAPVFIGVCFGFTASLIGMLVGRAIVFTWRTFYRRGQRKCCARIDQRRALCTGDNKDQKESLLDHVEPPPMYEDIPEQPKAED